MLQQIVHLWMFGPVELEEALEGLMRTGADGIDLSISLRGGHNNLETLRGAEARRAVGESGLPVKVVTPLYKLPELDFSHPDAMVSRTVVDFTCGCVDLAKEYGADRILVAPSYIGPDHRCHRSPEADWRRAVENLRHAARHAERQGVLLMLEPINRYMVQLVHTVAEGLRMMEDIGSPAVCLLPDAFHMNIEEPGGVLGGIRAGAGHMGCFHLGDNNRRPPSYGSMDWRAILRALAESGFEGPLSHEPVELYYSEGETARSPETFEAQLKASISFLRQCMVECL